MIQDDPAAAGDHTAHFCQTAGATTSPWLAQLNDRISLIRTRLWKYELNQLPLDQAPHDGRLHVNVDERRVEVLSDLREAEAVRGVLRRACRFPKHSHFILVRLRVALFRFAQFPFFECATVQQRRIVSRTFRSSITDIPSSLSPI